MTEQEGQDARYDAYWAAFFGVDVARLRKPGVSVVKHECLGDYSGVWFFARGASVIVSAPDTWLERLSSEAHRIAAEPQPSAALLYELFGRDPLRVIGPAYQGYLPRDGFHPVHRAEVSLLDSSASGDLAALRAACAPEEWDDSALSAASGPRFGCFVHDQLVAVAGTDRRPLGAVGVGVLTHPEHRGLGYGAAVVSAVVEQALAAGELLLYQTLMANLGSVAIAERLGFRHYATHVAVRL